MRHDWSHVWQPELLLAKIAYARNATDAYHDQPDNSKDLSTKVLREPWGFRSIKLVFRVHTRMVILKSSISGESHEAHVGRKDTGTGKELFNCFEWKYGYVLQGPNTRQCLLSLEMFFPE